MEIQKIKKDFLRIIRKAYPSRGDVFDILWDNISLWVCQAGEESAKKAESKRMEQLERIAMLLRMQRDSNTIRGIHNLLAEVEEFIEEGKSDIPK